MRTSVVTGGAGFIGSHLVDRLVERGDNVVVIDNLRSGKRERLNDRARFEEIDITDRLTMVRLAKQLATTDASGIDCWYHLAAQADVRVSVADPLLDAQINILGTIVVLEAAAITNSRVVFSSTGGAIYGDASIPTPESADEEPESPYGTAKLSAEKYIQMHARLYGNAHAIVRYSNVYGPRQDPHGEAGVVAIFGGKILAGEPATIYGDGSQTRDYVYVQDVVDTTMRASDIARNAPSLNGSGHGRDVPIYNVGTGVETSVVDLWKTMQNATGAELGETFAPQREGELQRSALDASRAREDLDVRLDTPLPMGLSTTIDWLRTGSAR